MREPSHGLLEVCPGVTGCNIVNSCADNAHERADSGSLSRLDRLCRAHGSKEQEVSSPDTDTHGEADLPSKIGPFCSQFPEMNRTLSSIAYSNKPRRT